MALRQPRPLVLVGRARLRAPHPAEVVVAPRALRAAECQLFLRAEPGVHRDLAELLALLERVEPAALRLRLGDLVRLDADRLVSGRREVAAVPPVLAAARVEVLALLCVLPTFASFASVLRNPLRRPITACAEGRVQVGA